MFLGASPKAKARPVQAPHLEMAKVPHPGPLKALWFYHKLEIKALIKQNFHSLI